MASSENDGDTVQIVINSLKAAGVKVVFGIPGAKIDSLFNALYDEESIRLVVCRHEQNAAFMAGVVGKLTNVPGVCIVTSGPGTSNLPTGLITATDEGSPMVAIVGSVKRAQSNKRTHQSLQNVELLKPVTKKTLPVVVEDQVAEIMLEAFRAAVSYPQGATAVSLPIDIMTPGKSKSAIRAFPPAAFTPPAYGLSSDASLSQAVKMIENAKFPVLFLGMRAASNAVVDQVHALLRKHPLPVVETFQAAGAISRDLAHLFFGRIGLWRNQPGDELLSHADLVITIGYDEIEYDAESWNPGEREVDIIHMDFHRATFGAHYEPRLELIGSLSDNLAVLNTRLQNVARPHETVVAKKLFSGLHAWETGPKACPSPCPDTGKVHPLHFIKVLQKKLEAFEQTPTISCDVGSVYIYFCRFFYSYVPKTFLVSNAQQTLGVALPWAIGASLAQEPPCSAKVVSISGDGGFQFSMAECATAVAVKANICHIIWNDQSYDMVGFQEQIKYGRTSGTGLGNVDFVKLAEAYGAKGFRIDNPSQLESTLEEALAWNGLSIVDVNIDYSDNQELMKQVVTDKVN
ncbi:acetolactate synthase [Pyricularia oryzae]|uniref:Acetolactate synthase n=2 Tax=Pyricularia oryzae TaxID=318829 RepID=A0AA97PP31_PYRO3|nr:acetolactate synthase [Pyricularia oryzae Y34]KAI7931966.1 acetolactate synthase [Pyricularia oryzae]